MLLLISAIACSVNCVACARVLAGQPSSMIYADFFDKLEGVARAVRKSRKPFGVIQLVLCGDFCQLPPVSKEGERKQYCFKVHVHVCHAHVTTHALNSFT